MTNHPRKRRRIDSHSERAAAEEATFAQRNPAPSQHQDASERSGSSSPHNKIPTIFGPGVNRFGRSMRSPKQRLLLDPSQKPHDEENPRPGPVEYTEKGELYSVESIIGFKKRKGRKQWLVKWEGWPDNEATWRLEEGLELDLGEEAFGRMRRELLREVVGWGFSEEQPDEICDRNANEKARERCRICIYFSHKTTSALVTSLG
ncbi:hypothetical protein FN846DRAFT_1025243 [Sphaerosporella brunnea]|uniref:Chromo domain-containing protein n=1 Tax=Sphaerosporella brunnea TaxID=1250544 RepID=A0A5J5EFR6_9PEZI|nr:hypothetical protein FN846DRAFT_1025243 [Sphaerosporella brunnea]